MTFKRTAFGAYLKYAKALGFGIGVGLPALTWFMDYTPPLVPNLGFLLGFVSPCIIWAAYWFPKSRRSKKKTPGTVWGAFVLVLLSILFFIVYSVALGEWTVADPQAGTRRFQIGFGKVDWSLTERGMYWKRKDPLMTAQEMMLAEAAFVEGGPERLWTPLSVKAAGVLTAIVYCFVFVSLNIGVGLLAGYRVKSETEEVLEGTVNEIGRGRLR